MPGRRKKVAPSTQFAKVTRAIHRKKDELNELSYGMGEISKAHGLFGKAKSKNLSAHTKQEFRDAHEAVLKCVSKMMSLASKIDRMGNIMDSAMILLHKAHVEAEQKRIFVPSKLWRSTPTLIPPPPLLPTPTITPIKKEKRK